MTKGFWVCAILTGLAWIGALVNGVFYLLHGADISLAAFFFCAASATYSTYNTLTIYNIDREMRTWDD